MRLASVNKISLEILRPAACPRDPEILNDAKNYCTDKGQTRSRGQAAGRRISKAAGRRGLKCKQSRSNLNSKQSLVKAVFILSTLFLVGCGFHLRGYVSMPKGLRDVSIIVESVNRDIAPMLKEQLNAYHIRVPEDPENAHYWLILEQDKEEQHITAVSSSTTPRQYQMNYQITFKLQAANGKEIIPSTHITTTRQITINSNRILGSSDEENTLKHEMRKDAVIQIMDRIGHQKL
ncbi:MAG: LPS assembly lipoprotein LptE [Gammaproteobacteria bacterium]